MARILLFDIENAPHKAYTWGLYEQNIPHEMVIEYGYMLCYCAKWLDNNVVLSDSLIDHPEHFKKNPTCDKYLAHSLWALLDEADIVVAHNGDGFDIKWANTIFARHKLTPPSKFRSIDTLKQARSNYKFPSNKLDSIGRELGLGRKVKHEGFDMWKKCMDGDEKAWNKMLKYCKQDVRLLEKVYLELRPYIKNHPNVNVDKDTEDFCCPSCGSSDIVRNGFTMTNAGRYQKYKCRDCGKWSRSSTNVNVNKVALKNE